MAPFFVPPGDLLTTFSRHSSSIGDKRALDQHREWEAARKVFPTHRS